MPRRWNGSSEREHLSTQRQKWNSRKTNICDGQLATYDELQQEKTVKRVLVKDSLVSQKALDAQIEVLRRGQPGKRRSTGDEENLKVMRSESSNEKDMRRELRARLKEINQDIAALKDGALSGTHLNGRRKSAHVMSLPDTNDQLDTALDVSRLPTGLQDDDFGFGMLLLLLVRSILM